MVFISILNGVKQDFKFWSGVEWTGLKKSKSGSISESNLCYMCYMASHVVTWCYMDPFGVRISYIIIMGTLPMAYNCARFYD